MLLYINKMSFTRPDIIRPPSEWRSYYLPLTSGCSNNTCAFCNFYGCKLEMRDPAEVKAEVDALALYQKSRLRLSGMPGIVYMVARDWDGKQVFLQDADALVYPYDRIHTVLEYLNAKLPGIERVATYATARDILQRTPAELAELRRLKLGIVYIGLESGDDAILKSVAKGADAAQMIAAARKAREAGILTSITVLLGLGGTSGSEKHALDTARVLSEMDPDYVGALTLTLVPGTPLYRAWQEGTFEPVSPFQSLKELRLIIAGSRFSNCFFSSMHASNYFAVRGSLPRDKTKMLGELDAIISRDDSRLLRPEFLRGL